jgi:glyoxylase-like metal-dependent hydrolase (beta-lactamase superfamily II)
VNSLEVASGIHRLEAPLGDRYVALYLIEGDEAALLVDTGVAGSPAEALGGVDAGRIRYVLVSHADFDHTGGNAAVRELCPGAIFCCHDLDRPLVEDLEAMLYRRYGEAIADHGIDDGDEARDSIRSNARHVPIELALTGGERLRLGGDREIEILHTPGHSRGHVTVWDPAARVAVIADAVLWNAVLGASGEPVFPPTYRYVDAYVATIQRLQGMPIETLLTSHYPVYRGEEVGEFLAESRAFVDRADAALREELSAAAEPPTLRELCDRLGPRLGSWPAEATATMWFPLLGHLERLAAFGLLSTGRRDGVVTFRWSGG